MMGVTAPRCKGYCLHREGTLASRMHPWRFGKLRCWSHSKAMFLARSPKPAAILPKYFNAAVANSIIEYMRALIASCHEWPNLTHRFAVSSWPREPEHSQNRTQTPTLLTQPYIGSLPRPRKYSKQIAPLRDQDSGIVEKLSGQPHQGP